jgi:predicted AlkP superfamily phosphohydrolase/phosphomutase
MATLGLGVGLYSADNDTGPDHANHAEQGIFMLARGGQASGQRSGLSLYDVAPTLHELLGLPPDPAHRGRLIR